jgi:hypothetical protein
VHWQRSQRARERRLGALATVATRAAHARPDGGSRKLRANKGPFRPAWPARSPPAALTRARAPLAGPVVLGLGEGAQRHRAGSEDGALDPAAVFDYSELPLSRDQLDSSGSKGNRDCASGGSPRGSGWGEHAEEEEERFDQSSEWSNSERGRRSFDSLGPESEELGTGRPPVPPIAPRPDSRAAAADGPLWALAALSSALMHHSEFAWLVR